MKNKRVRFFAIVTYASPTDFVKVLNEHSTSVRSYACCVHDKDETSIHMHVVLRTYQGWSSEQLSKWFTKDAHGQNTFVEPVYSHEGISDYLTHENSPEKHRYSRDEIFGENISDALAVTNSVACDNSFEIVDALLQGVSYLELVRRYGRDFVYHVGAYAHVAEVIRSEQA